MLIRAIALSIALVIGVGVIVPLATETTEAGPHHSKYKRHHKYRKYSKAWWRQYHRRQRARRALAARRRALRLEQLRMAEARKTEKSGTPDKKDIVKTSAAVEPPSLLPSGEEAPRGWKKTSATPGELKFGLTDSSGRRSATRRSPSSVRRWAITMLETRWPAFRPHRFAARSLTEWSARTAGSLTTIERT
jgi:hypothetical protein